ncbi:hypothetical protein V2J09_003504 [Rumex salicifolius]
MHLLMSGPSSEASSVPLLRSRNGGSDASESSSGSGNPPQASLALLLGRAAGRRGPSILVRETAALELDQRRADWGYSKPVVALDIFWNMAFVAASVVMLICTARERPNVPVRVWICVYAFQCLVHVVLVWLEYRRRFTRAARMRRGDGSRHGDEEAAEPAVALNESDDEYDPTLGVSTRTSYTNPCIFVLSSFAKNCESINTMASFLWWIVGFYWVISGGDILIQDAPRLYWLTVIFLAFDVFFAIFCIILACLIGVALCCCLPCIIAILYSVAGQEGASDADLSVLPKYTFRSSLNEEKTSIGAGVMVPVESSSAFLATERVLLPEDAECCICLSCYEDGAELHTLPCNHHFHATCITKWLKMNATCPLCKFNILKGNEQRN